MPKKFKQSRKTILAGALLGLILLVVILELTGVTHIFRQAKVPPVISVHTSSGATVNTPSASGSSSGSSNGTANPNLAPTSQQTEHTLIAPFGDFVSNHFPGKNGSPTSESSVCNTSPGASCYIKFTKVGGSESTQLPAQTADARGSTTWNWDINSDAHLTSGDWKVTAVATLGAQTKSTDDALKLNIQ
jgi:hypothetical protein